MSKMVNVEKDFAQVFLGRCKGVGIRPRNAYGDTHAMFVILTEDDGWWYEGEDGTASAYWMPELIEQLQKAKEWLDQNATEYSYGWLLKQ